MLRYFLRRAYTKIFRNKGHSVPFVGESGPEPHFLRLAPEMSRVLGIKNKLNILFGGAGSTHNEPYWNSVDPASLNSIFVDPLWEAEQVRPSHIIACALSNSKGSSELFVCATADASSLKIQNPVSMNATTFYHHGNLFELMKPVGKVVVETDTVDRLQSEGVLPRLDFIKLNVEGSELDVLEGAKKALDQCLGIQTEVSFKSLWSDAPHFSDIDAFIRSRGFEFYQLLAPIHHGKLNSYLKLHQSQNVGLFPYPSQQLFQSHVLYLRPETFVCENGKLNCTIDDAIKLIWLYEIYGLLENAFYLAESLLPFVAPNLRVILKETVTACARGYAAKYPDASVVEATIGKASSAVVKNDA